MGIFDIFKRKKAVYVPPKGEAVPEEKARLIIDEFIKTYSVQSIMLTAKRGKPNITDSKFGGIPYIPLDFEYPRDKDGYPLRLLAQLNFNTLPSLDKFPQKGILQFFIAADDDVHGANFDNLTGQDNFRIVYHPDTNDGGQLSDSFSGPTDSFFPFTGEYVLTAEIEPCVLTCNDYRFDEKFMDVCKKHLDTNASSYLDFDDDFTDMIFDELSKLGHRLGGYPHFTQYDPRNDESSQDVLLLQIDTDWTDGENDIMWGDGGVANFFISSADLVCLDFSNVLYTWDCC